VKAIVSVVIPTFNRRLTVSKAIASALAQTIAVEVIVVDDGSQDQTAEYLLKVYGDQIKVVSKPNGGVSSARNAGVKAAACNWVAFLDSDDYWLPNKLQAQLDVVKKFSDITMVLTDIQFTNKSSEPVNFFQRKNRYANKNSALYDVLLSPYLIPSSVLILREAFENLNGFNEALPTAEDLDFHIRVAENYSIANVESPLTVCALADSDGLSELDRSIPDHISVVRLHVDRLEGSSLSVTQRKNVLFNLYVDNATSASGSKKFLLALKCALNAMKYINNWTQLATWVSTVKKFPKRMAYTLFVRLRIYNFFNNRPQ
jgi:glycosyltransferase involved in cell wall biosynthesis